MVELGRRMNAIWKKSKCKLVIEKEREKALISDG